jgi:hypothetical protein
MTKEIRLRLRAATASGLSSAIYEAVAIALQALNREEVFQELGKLHGDPWLSRTYEAASVAGC